MEKTFTKEELKAIEYHLNYDLENIEEGIGWAEAKDIGINKKVSQSALAKLRKLNK